MLIKGLINVIKTYTFDGGVATRVKLYLSVLSMLTALSQQQYLYHVDKGQPRYLNYSVVYQATCVGDRDKPVITDQSMCVLDISAS